MQHHLKNFYTKLIIRYFKKMSHLILQFTRKKELFQNFNHLKIYLQTFQFSLSSFLVHVLLKSALFYFLHIKFIRYYIIYSHCNLHISGRCYSAFLFSVYSRVPSFYSFCSVLEIISHCVVLSRVTNCAQYPATLTIISLCFSG